MFNPWENKMSKKTRISICILCFFLMFLFLCSAAFAKDSKILSIKGDYNYPPFEYLNEKQLPDGFNVDIMKAVAKAMGIRINIELDSWHKVRKELKQRKIDALMGMFKTEEREKNFDFSTPHFIASYAVFIRKNSKIKSLKDVHNKTIIVEKSDLGYDYLIKNRVTDKLILKDTVNDVIKALSSGEGDCALISRLQGMMILKKEKIKNIIPAGSPVIQRKYCIAVAKGNKELLAKINEGLNIIKTSGIYDKIYNKWFGVYENKGLNYHKILKYLFIIILPLILISFFAFLWVFTLKKQVALKAKQLLESSENLKITLNSIGDAVIATDIKSKITRMNPAAERLTGWDNESANGKPLHIVFKIVNAKTLENVENPVKKVIKTGKITGLANHTMLISKHGEKYQIADSAAPIKDNNGVIQGIVIVFRDVTQKYKMSEQLRETQETFSAFMDYLPGEAFIKDENFKFIFINNYMKKHRNAGSWIGKDLFTVPLSAEIAERITKDDKKAIKQGSYEAEEYKPDADGIYRYYLTHRFPIVLPNGKKFVGGISIDISERKKTEHALKRSEEKYRRLIEATSEGFILIDFENKIIDVNQSLCSMLGCSRNEIIGKTPFDFVDDENYEIFKKQIAKIKTSLYRNYEISLKKRTGENFPAFFNATTLIDRNEKIINSFAFVTDLTEMKKNEKELQKMEQLNSIGTLAGGIAHDFNNIMTGLFGNISIAKSKIAKDNPGHEALEKAENAINRARDLTNQLLTFAKGGSPVQKNFSIEKFAEEVIRFDLSGSSIKPVFTIPENLWMVKGDTTQIQQVFSNLTINAVHAMPDGGHLYINFENAFIKEKTKLPLKQGQYLKVIFRDQGTGIDKKIIDRIFDPYFTTKKTGSGLGLSMVFSIITKHNGFIEVDSKPGHGTKFTFYLPAAADEHPDKTAEKHDDDGKKTKALSLYGRAKILVMDDEEMIREVASEMLKRKGYSVETASDGSMAIEMYKKSIASEDPFDVIIMDLTIPGGIGGEDAVKDILTINPKACVIVSSGYADDPVMADYTAYGFKGLIAKPYTMDNIDKVLKKVLNAG